VEQIELLDVETRRFHDEREVARVGHGERGEAVGARLGPDARTRQMGGTPGQVIIWGRGWRQGHPERSAGDAVELLHDVVGESQVGSGDVLPQVSDRGRAGDQGHGGRALQQPGERGLLR
jgi:hypothetical protein